MNRFCILIASLLVVLLETELCLLRDLFFSDIVAFPTLK